eukprot:485081-Pyramimonas_sp.AAC.1
MQDLRDRSLHVVLLGKRSPRAWRRLFTVRSEPGLAVGQIPASRGLSVAIARSPIHDEGAVEHQQAPGSNHHRHSNKGVVAFGFGGVGS